MMAKGIGNICCIGAGFVGGPTSAVIASKAPDIKCTVVDSDQARIDAWNSEVLPFYEPNLYELVKVARDGIPKEREANLFFTSDIDSSIAEADVIFISVNTPTKTTGVGAGRACDLASVESAARMIAKSVKGGHKIIVEKSTVPCGTAASIRDIITENTDGNFTFDVLSNPEFLAEGSAIEDLLHPDRVLIGSLDETDFCQTSAEMLADIYCRWVSREKIIFMNAWSSELAKIAANAMLAQRISSINSLSAICEATQSEIKDVATAIGLDHRIGSQMLRASVGFGGSCFRKDVLSLVYLADYLNLSEVAAYWKSVIEINEWQKSRFTNGIIRQLYGSLTRKRVAVLGFAYKSNTSDARESPSISIINDLTAEAADVAVYDPQVGEAQIFEALARHSCSTAERIRDLVTVTATAHEACHQAHAVIILTGWDEFRHNPRDAAVAKQANLDWHSVAQSMRRPMSVFDGANIVDPRFLENLGFRVHCIGRASS